MIQQIVALSLIITGLYVCFFQGNILGWFRIFAANEFDRVFGRKWSRYIQKPLWDCLPCMSGLWTIVITQGVDLLLILAVCGLNAIIDHLFPNLEERFHEKEAR